VAVLTNEWLLVMLIGLLAGLPFITYRQYKQEQKAIERHGQKIDTLKKRHNETINSIDSINIDTLNEYFSREMLRPNSYEQTKSHNNK
jgi:hypothetical protein